MLATDGEGATDAEDVAQRVSLAPGTYAGLKRRSARDIWSLVPRDAKGSAPGEGSRVAPTL
jgi:hypothetical protein